MIRNRLPTLSVNALLAACTVLAPGLAIAHPGHGTTAPESVQHYVLEPVHAVPVVILLVAIGGLWVWLRAKKSKAAEQRAPKANSSDALQRRRPLDQ
jgi:hypothetical protein